MLQQALDLAVELIPNHSLESFSTTSSVELTALIEATKKIKTERAEQPIPAPAAETNIGSKGNISTTSDTMLSSYGQREKASDSLYSNHLARLLKLAEEAIQNS
jgi:hypothetical protein